MPGARMGDMVKSLRGKRIARSLTKKDIARSILVLMELWASQFPEESLPRTMNEELKEMERDGDQEG